MVVDQDQLPIDSTNYLNSQNLKVEIGTAVGTSTSTTGSRLASSTTPWTFQDATNVIITFQGGAAGGAISYVMTQIKRYGDRLGHRDSRIGEKSW